MALPLSLGIPHTGAAQEESHFGSWLSFCLHPEHRLGRWDFIEEKKQKVVGESQKGKGVHFFPFLDVLF